MLVPLDCLGAYRPKRDSYVRNLIVLQVWIDPGRGVLLTYIFWIVVLAAVGAMNWGEPGLVLGAVSGWLLGMLVISREKRLFKQHLREELQPLSDRVAALEQNMASPGEHDHESVESPERPVNEPSTVSSFRTTGSCACPCC